MGVPNEDEFKANVTEHQLYSIECKELGMILEELSTHVLPQQSHRLQQQQHSHMVQMTTMSMMMNIIMLVMAWHEF